MNGINQPEQKQKKKSKEINDRNDEALRFLESGLHLSQCFLQADTETEVIQALLQELSLLLSAFGASYIPFDEQKEPQIYYRDKPGALSKKFQSWLAYLSAPAIRSQCRICQKDEPTFQICPLLNNPFIEDVRIFCFRVMRSKIKYGVVTLYLPPYTAISKITVDFLQNIAEITAICIENQKKRPAQQRLNDHSSSKDPGKPIENQLQHETNIILQERSRLAREYHDGLAQILAFLKIQIAQMDGFIEAGNVIELLKTAKLSYQAVSEAYIDVREAIDDLHQNPLQENFSSWLQDLASRFSSNFEIPINISNFPDDLLITPDVRLHLTRIIQEALSNIRKHAEASSIDLEYQDDNHDFTIRITDDGLGFVPENVSTSTKHGLVSMEERARLIHAELIIISSTDQGTTIQIKIPKTSQNET